MKTSFAAVAVVLLSATSALASLGPKPTPHVQMAKRQKFPDGINVSAMLANPSSYVHEVSSALNDKKHGKHNARVYSSLTHNPKFQKSLSHELIHEFGSKTGASALSQYQSFLKGLDYKSQQAAALASSQAASAAAAAATTTAVAASPVAANVASTSIAAVEATQTSDATSNQVVGATSGAASDMAVVNMAMVAAAVAGALAVAAI